jgi:hypothetical protein
MLGEACGLGQATNVLCVVPVLTANTLVHRVSVLLIRALAHTELSFKVVVVLVCCAWLLAVWCQLTLGRATWAVTLAALARAVTNKHLAAKVHNLMVAMTLCGAAANKKRAHI